MSWYRTGAVTVTNNSNVVTGAGTSWIESAKEGDIFQGPDMISYEITQIASATSLRISPAYRGGSAAGQGYALIPTRSRDPEIATGVSTLVQSYQSVRDNAGTGKFAAGAAGAPSLRGLADQDTGINFAGDNVLQLIAGGIVKAHLTSMGLVDAQFEKYLTPSSAISGIAAGGVMERGSNSHGNYVRLSCGLQICTASIQGYVAGVNSFVFPAAFVDVPSCAVSINPSGGWAKEDGIYGSTEMWVINMPTASAANSLQLSAIGWYK